MNAVARIAILLPALAALPAGCQRATPPAATGTAAVPARPVAPPAPASGARITRLELGNAVDAQGQVVQPLVRFAPRDTFHASIELVLPDAAAHALDARWTYLDTRQTVLEERKPVAGPGRVLTTLQLSKPDAWPDGQYRLELLLDGQLAQARVFEVAAAAP
ncbi:hypothetical protein [Thermomonas haemolytica]|uniref:Uncharacterized protein n=1 Tax=Thermomonas haemolytica TaxID=141949 RepID=A0A4R3NDG6_9GAMM|nr:hypothetical protein [Thermomonas haemolytica]TCT25224.1 hypothetical protein EDC34_102112 [Thermomonas haemolytica]TNY29898.1 hypothetical protein BV505_02560 [Thermomonas haemolytica]